MSFSHDVKSELCALKSGVGTDAAVLYGMLLFGRSLSASAVVLQTEHEAVADKASELLERVFRVRPERRIAPRSDAHGVYILTIEDPKQAGRIYRSYGYDEKTLSLRINRANIESPESVPAFLRGAFLSCGSVVDPEKDYHLEFVTPHLNLSRDLSCLLAEQELEPKTIRRKGNCIVYFKDSGQIEMMLTLMGSMRKTLELMNVKVYKDLRNRANRVTNCETANIEKTVNASAAQIEAIRRIVQEKGLGSLPEDLREIAALRLDNPDISLRELGAMLKTPLSRSGANHRLSRLMELSKKLGPS